MSENIVENALRAPNFLQFSGGEGGGMPPDPPALGVQGIPTFSKPTTPLFHTGNEGSSCFPHKIKLLDRTLSMVSMASVHLGSLT